MVTISGPDGEVVEGRYRSSLQQFKTVRPIHFTGYYEILEKKNVQWSKTPHMNRSTVAIAFLALFGFSLWSAIATKNFRIERQFRLLKSDDDSVREKAARTLGRIGSFSYDERLATALKTEQSSRVRIAIIKALMVLSRKLMAAEASERKLYDREREREQAAARLGRRADRYPFATTSYSPGYYLSAIKEFIIPGLEKSLHSSDTLEREAALSALMLIDLPEARTAIDTALRLSDSDEVHFTAYFPSEASTGSRHTLRVYAHVQEALAAIEEDLRMVQEGSDKKGSFSHERAESSQIRVGTMITVVPDCRTLSFDPPLSSSRWNGDWIPFYFEFEPLPLLGTQRGS